MYIEVIHQDIGEFFCAFVYGLAVLSLEPVLLLLNLYHKASKEGQAMFYTVIKHSRHFSHVFNVY
jgi:hypothetical protein